MKRIIIIILICFNIISKADYWTQKADFGGVARGGAVGFCVGNKGFIGTGTDYQGVIFADFWEYNPLTNVWTQKADFGGGVRCYASGFVINNKGFVGCGGNNTIFLNDFWEYDPSTNIWTQKSNFGGGARGLAVSFSINNKGYVGTGTDNPFLFKDFWEYDPLTDTWTQKINFGGTARNISVGFSDGSKGYIGTGADSITYPYGKVDFWEWNPSTNVWTQKVNFGGTAREEACAFWLCPYGYVGLGTTQINVGTVSDFWKYNIATNTWIQVANFGAGLREMAVAFAIGNKGYVGTGWINDVSPKRDFWEYIPDSSCATVVEELPHSNLEFTIFPNPAKDFIFVNYSLNINEKINLTITDVNGKNVFQKQLSQSSISLKRFSKGIYFVEANNGKQKVVRKFVKE